MTYEYKKLGQQLGIPDHELKFDANSSRSLEDCASDMLSIWLHQDPKPSWKILIGAIKKTTKAPNLVKDLQDKYKGN